MKTWMILGVLAATAVTAAVWQSTHRAPRMPMFIDTPNNTHTSVPEEASSSQRVYRLVVVASYESPHLSEMHRHRQAYLQEHGYIPGQNLKIIRDVDDNDVQHAKAILLKRLAAGADVVCVDGSAAAMAAGSLLDEFRNVSFVFANVTDPVGLGLIDDFSSPPERNMTGVSYPVAVKERLRFIKAVLPGIHRFGMIVGEMASSRSYRQWIESLVANDAEFRDMHFVFRVVPLSTTAELSSLGNGVVEAAIRELDGQVDAFVSSNDALGVRKDYVEAVARLTHKPVIGLGRADVMDGWGASLSIFPSHAGIGRQCGRMVAALFSGTPITEIPAEQPEKIGMAFDLNRLRQFGISVPEELVQAAGSNVIGGDLASQEAP